jgi:hypothetical protein
MLQSGSPLLPLPPILSERLNQTTSVCCVRRYGRCMKQSVPFYRTNGNVSLPDFANFLHKSKWVYRGTDVCNTVVQHPAYWEFLFPFRTDNFMVWHEPFKTQWLRYVPPGVTLKHSTCCPTKCIYVFRVDLRTNRSYFPLLH